MADRIFTGDTATIVATLYDEDGVGLLPATAVNWKVRKPDGTIYTGGPEVVSESGANILFTETTDPGLYQSQVQFDLVGGGRHSTLVTFEVVDPLETTEFSDPDDPVEKVIDRAWMKLEDMFDSELGGPWLRDKTLQILDRDKLRRFLPDALYAIGATYQPVASYDETNFPFEGHTPLLAQGILIEAIYHLIRSYAEQPLPVGGNVTYFDRRDYLQRWQSILDKEEARFMSWMDLFKKEQMGYGSTATLLGGYSNIYGRSPRYMRGRYPYVHRAW